MPIFWYDMNKVIKTYLPVHGMNTIGKTKWCITKIAGQCVFVVSKMRSRQIMSTLDSWIVWDACCYSRCFVFL